MPSKHLFLDCQNRWHRLHYPKPRFKLVCPGHKDDLPTFDALGLCFKVQEIENYERLFGHQMHTVRLKSNHGALLLIIDVLQGFGDACRLAIAFGDKHYTAFEIIGTEIWKLAGQSVSEAHKSPGVAVPSVPIPPHPTVPSASASADPVDTDTDSQDIESESGSSKDLLRNEVSLPPLLCNQLLIRTSPSRLAHLCRAPRCGWPNGFRRFTKALRHYSINRKIRSASLTCEACSRM